MKILPINKSIFRGRTISYNSDSGIEGIKHLPGFYTDSSIEKTLGISHRIPKNAVYFADPMEFVSNDMKYDVDYVVYDNEPSYPKLDDIHRNYFDKNRTNYREKFEQIRDYFYRREMGRYANIYEAKYQQWQAAECIRLYDKAGDLRYKKETAEDEVNNLRMEKYNISAGISKTKKVLDSHKQLNKSLTIHIDNLKQILKSGNLPESLKIRAAANEEVLYSVADSKVKDILDKRQMFEALENSAYYNEWMEAYPGDKPKYERYSDNVKIYALLKNQMEKSYCIGPQIGTIGRNKTSAEDTIKGFEEIQKENSVLMGEIEAYIEELRLKLSSFDEKIAQRENIIETFKQKLTPLFEELKAYYLKQRINIIKK